MSKPTPAAKTPITAKQPAKAAPAPDVQRGAALADVAAGTLDLSGAASLQGQADRLNNVRLQAIQRQLLAGKIGQQQGNGHLQQVMAFAKQAQGHAPYQPHSNKIPNANNGNGKALSQPQPPTSGEGETDQEPLSSEELAALWEDQAGVAVTGAEPPPNPAGAHPSLQRQPETPTVNQAPTEAEKAAAKAKAAAARAQAAQAQSQGQAESDKFQARKETEKTVGQTAKQKADAAKTATVAPLSGAPSGAPNVAVNGAAAKGGKKANPGVGNGVAPTAGPEGGVAAKAPASPAEDPAFQATVAKVQGVADQEQTHAPAGAKAKEAQAAAESPASELAGKAQSNQVGEMAAAETPGFDAKGFKAKLMARIQALTPKNAADADEFKEQNKAGELKGELQGETTAQKEQSQAPLAAATDKAPDTGSVEPKPTTPLQPNAPGAGPGEVNASGAAPKTKSQGEVEAPLQQQSQQLDKQMASANVTEEQLTKSNEPEFQTAASAKQESQAHAQSAPQAYRQDEQGIVAQAQAGAMTTAQSETAAMHNERASVLAQVDGQQGQGKSEDEKARAAVGAKIQSLYDATQSKVDAILASLDSEVDQLFNEGAEASKQTFERYVDAEMEAYKEERYGGLLGWAQWVADKFQPTQPEILAIFQRGRQIYINAMDAVIDNVVALIGRKLAEAKAEIANGKQEIQKYVATLAPNLQQVGQEAAQAIQSQFEQLEQGVDAKQDELIDKLATQYNEKLQAVDARIEELKAENETFYDKAANAIGGVIKTIMQLKDMLLNVLARAAAAIEKIIADPIGFLGNLVAGVKQGLQNFVGNIGTHLKEGLIGWLTGAVAGAGITLPDNWDLPGIFQFVMQLLGLSFESIMGKVSKLFGFDVMTIIDPVKQIIEIYQAEGFEGLARAGLSRLLGEERMLALMQVWEMVQQVISGNWNALWGLIHEHLSNLKEMVFGKIEEFISERVIKAGITWVVSLLNPAGAFIKACKAIYDIVMFFVERGSQIMSLVNAVIDSISSIASGNIGAAASAVENALARGIPVAIGFLSSLLGLGNVSEKVQEIIQSVRGLVDKALDAVFNSKPVQMVVGFIKKVIGKITGLVKKAGNAVAQAGLPTDPNERLNLGMEAALSIINRFEGKRVGKLVLVPLLGAVKVRYGFKSLDVVAQDGIWWVSAEINPKDKKPSKHVKVGDGNEVVEDGKLLKKMPLMEVTFYVKTNGSNGKEGLDFSEFSRQLLLQQNGINAMTIDTWISNKTNFKPLDGSPSKRDSKGDNDIKKLKASFEAQLNGEPLRPKPDNLDEDGERLYSLMVLAQRELQRMRVAVITENPSLARPENREKLTEAVRTVFKASTGLHRVDQIAGGSGRDIAGLGGAREDFSIGAAWAQARGDYLNRVDTVHKNIEKTVDKNVFPTEKMNLNLVPQEK